ncbi:AAA-like domain-containing protein [Parafrankia irregularis]|uniref:AAA-like domain-containing protein n=1 Tax=Parafrankia irregularis TaxID=795642 RepID=A0A0S4QRA3_9ACTN|nr:MULTISPECIES: FtsK/SpoIIIE domain-containing protein [Parafrankia]MBE3201632.1 ATP-binding protein [Parafrankia sp. CH37]CUU57372.1 AAA-like domain-containing protein [Parafrankia irregularis]
MSTASVTTAKVDYLQRCGPGPRILAEAWTEGVLASRRLLQVRGVGRPEKAQHHKPAVQAERWRSPTTELVTGLYGYLIPLALQIIGSPDGVRVQLGTWSARPGSEAAQVRRIGVIESVLRGLHPVVDVEAVTAQSPRWPLGGMALGVPAPAGIDHRDGAAPMDRIIRSMTGTAWSVLVLAYPLREDTISHVRDSVLNEMRAVTSAARNELAPSPLTDQYVEFLKASLLSTGEGLAIGAWRTAVYLGGDRDSYPRLASAWRSVMSGERSLPEPVRVFERAEVAGLAAAWAMPNQPGDSPPGLYRRPFECQTFLSTAQLAACAHLPEIETPGFAVDVAPRFDVVARPADHDSQGFVIGRVLQHRRPTAGTYEITRRSLTRHVFVAGLTGSGKTNTIMSMLVEAAAHNVPFMVIEPAKTEYRALIDHPALGSRMRVFTAGKATIGPFVLNPFEVPEGTTVGEHLNLLRAVFTAAFGMWTPLPQILERCLHDIYVDRGWDLRTNTNARLTAPDGGHGTGLDVAAAFPTLSDLIAKTEHVIKALGYDEKVTGDLTAALVTRLDSLRQGAKGAMLDVVRSLPARELFGMPTVVELEALGDEGDRAFFSGLLLIRLAEYRRAQGQSPDLVHLLVVEEAHRLLANVATSVSEETANPRGEAVQTFSNLLSEIRAYGQGVVIADQVPVRLAPDVMKNTNLKIAHRIVAADDRQALAGTMAMDERQSTALTALGVGEAAVFSGGDDAPLLVQVPLVKDAISPVPPPDARVAEHMRRWRVAGRFDELFLSQPFCARTCATPAACEAARRLADDEYVQRTLGRVTLSVVNQPDALERLWDDLVLVLRARRPVTVRDDDLLRAYLGHGSDLLATRRGVQGGWSYADTAGFRDRLRELLLAKLAGSPQVAALTASLRATVHRLHPREFRPYPACELVCAQDPPLCLYRSAVADLVASGRYQSAWRTADEGDLATGGNRAQQTWEVCQDAAYELVEFPDPEMPAEVSREVEVAARRVCVCFEQQMLADDRRKLPRTTRRILARVVAEAGL